MRIADMNWMQVEALLAREDRCVLPLGSTEQHAYLSLATDSLLAEKMAVDAAQPLGVPVFPVLPFGITPQFRAYHGTISIRVDTYALVLADILDGLRSHGFRRIVVVNGHGGNSPMFAAASEWAMDCGDVQVKWHDWWRAPSTWAKVIETDPNAAHASWMENFPWTRLAGVAMPSDAKPMADVSRVRLANPQGIRAALGDGSFGGRYVRSDDEMEAIWGVAVEETRHLIAEGWL